jgi:chromate reductase, NAD(P)H dehydrogenase (quinone)
MQRKKIFAIIGSASTNSANLQIVKFIASIFPAGVDLEIFDRLKGLPHFDTELTIENTPAPVLNFRARIENADAVLICTPEYVFSIPSGLKNAIEWCVSTTAFSNKITGIITASAHGVRGHEELQMIMRTVGANVLDPNCLLIQGVKAKVANGVVSDEKTIEALKQLAVNICSSIYS